MGRTRTFDPPLTFGEIAKVYDFTTKLITALGLSGAWRLQVRDSPCPGHAYATIVPIANTHIGELALNIGWQALDLEGERIPTLVHEILHLTHRGLTDAITDDMHSYVGAFSYVQMHARWTREIELWTDHMTQFVLGALRSQIEEWAAEIWGDDWRDQGDTTSAGQRAARGETA